jgi:endonuclease G
MSVSLEPGARVATADLAKTATLQSMTRLGGGEELAARAGHEPTTPPESFEEREGYQRDFLDGWKIELPRPKGARAADVRTLRRGGRGSELKYEHFSVLMSVSRRMPMLTAVNISGDESRRLPRIQTWSYDGRLDPADQWGDALYDGNELDRGHMVRREDPVWGAVAVARLANEDTFHFTNSCPQMAGVNQHIWLGLEDYILKNARVESLRVTVFTGPFFGDDDLEYRGARVPLAFWKVVAIVTAGGRPSATAYRVSQKKELAELEFRYAGYRTFQVSVKQVADATGIDFGPLLPYDGFSAHELATNERLEEQLDSFASIRV